MADVNSFADRWHVICGMLLAGDTGVEVTTQASLDALISPVNALTVADAICSAQGGPDTGESPADRAEFADRWTRSTLHAIVRTYDPTFVAALQQANDDKVDAETAADTIADGILPEMG